MKYGFFSDVHANLEAFQAVLDALTKEKVDGYVFLGDIVGYGADPKECVHMLRELMKEKGCLAVAGNHDFAVCGRTSTAFFNPFAKEAVDWTRRQLDTVDIDFLAGLPLVERQENFTAVHANLLSPENWGYILDIDDAAPNFKKCEDPLCFIGHSHKAMIFKSHGTVEWMIKEEVRLEDGAKYIINIGSVGQPRDGNPDTAYAIYDTDQGKVFLRRQSYDVAGAQGKIKRAGLPQVLADRLEVGK